MAARYLIDEDPLSRILAPPPNETLEEREARLRLEAEARLISDRIDEQLKAERAALKKNRPVKVLLLGQSESGKSTTLKRESLPPPILVLPRPLPSPVFLHPHKPARGGAKLARPPRALFATVGRPRTGWSAYKLRAYTPWPAPVPVSASPRVRPDEAGVLCTS